MYLLLPVCGLFPGKLSSSIYDYWSYLQSYATFLFLLVKYLWWICIVILITPYVKVLDNIPVYVILTTFPLKDFFGGQFSHLKGHASQRRTVTAVGLFPVTVVRARKEVRLAYLWLTESRLTIPVKAHGKNGEFFRNNKLRNGGAAYFELWVSKLCFIFLYSSTKPINFLSTITSLDAQG